MHSQHFREVLDCGSPLPLSRARADTHISKDTIATDSTPIRVRRVNV